MTASHGVLAWSITLKVLAGRSIRVMVTGVVLVSVATSMAGVAVIAYRMLPGVDQDVVLDLMAIAGLAGLIVALVVGRQLIKASRAISSAVQGVGDSGVYIAPQRTHRFKRRGRSAVPNASASSPSRPLARCCLVT